MKRDLRTILHSGYTLVRSIEANKASSAKTLDHFIKEQISGLKKDETTSFVNASGEKYGSRNSKWDELNTLSESITEMVKAVESAGDDVIKLQSLGIFEASDSEG